MESKGSSFPRLPVNLLAGLLCVYHHDDSPRCNTGRRVGSPVLYQAVSGAAPAWQLGLLAQVIHTAAAYQPKSQSGRLLPDAGH